MGIHRDYPSELTGEPLDESRAASVCATREPRPLERSSRIKGLIVNWVEKLLEKANELTLLMGEIAAKIVSD